LTSFETSSDSRWNATQSWLTIGSLIAAIAAPTAGRKRRRSMRIWWCSVANCLAITSEYANSSPLSPAAASNPMLNVVSPRCPPSASSATMKLESRPPDSSTPTGTSATMRRSTAVRSRSRTASRHASGGIGVAGRLNGGFQ
jgi:hypothetical protein